MRGFCSVTIEPADLLPVEAHTPADRKRLWRCAGELTQSLLLAEAALGVLPMNLPRGPVMDVWTRTMIATQLRTTMVAHQAALLRALEIREISRRMERA